MAGIQWAPTTRTFPRRSVLALIGGVALATTVARPSLAATTPGTPATPATPPPVTLPDGPTIDVSPGESIQAAIDALPAGGGTVRLAAGTHVIAEPVYVRSSLVLEGRGKARTRIEVAEAYVENFVGMHPTYVGEGMIDLVQGGVEDLVLRGFTLDGHIPLDTRERDGSDGRGGESLHRPWGILLEDRASANSEEFSDNNARIEIADVEVCRTETGLHVKGCTGLWVHDSDFHHNGGVLLYYHNMYLRRDRQVLVERNRLTDCHSANGLNLTDQQDLTVRHNHFANNYFRGIRAAASERVLITDNLAEGSQTDWGLLLVSEGAGVSDFTVSDNLVLGNFRGLNVSSATNGVVTGNTVFGNQGGDNTVVGASTDVDVTAPTPTWAYLEHLVAQLRSFELITNPGTASALTLQARRGNRQVFGQLVSRLAGRTINQRAADLLLQVLGSLA